MAERIGSLEGVGVNPSFWNNKRVFLTGHTGFKGSWLSLLLAELGARSFGYSLPPPTEPSLFEMASVAACIQTHWGDVTNLAQLQTCLESARPEIVIHLAAQSLVRVSYTDPVGTYAANVMGTVHLLDAARRVPSVRAIVIVTSDKCYDNREWPWGYRENESMGGRDPYSSSKGCAELITAAYRDSFFPKDRYDEHGVAVASVRAGNVIGGGDWAPDRLVPDLVRAALAGRKVLIRNPLAVRPWQHVLEPLRGYLMLAEKLCTSGPEFAEAWNFGPEEYDARPVQYILEQFASLWGDGADWEHDRTVSPHEAHLLKLDISKAKLRLGWRPALSLSRALEGIVDWYKAHQRDQAMESFTRNQITAYLEGLSIQLADAVAGTN